MTGSFKRVANCRKVVVNATQRCSKWHRLQPEQTAKPGAGHRSPCSIHIWEESTGNAQSPSTSKCRSWTAQCCGFLCVMRAVLSSFTRSDETPSPQRHEKQRSVDGFADGGRRRTEVMFGSQYGALVTQRCHGLELDGRTSFPPLGTGSACELQRSEGCLES